MATVDHRRATADRNRRAILDATERLLAEHAPLSMAAVASAAGVSRPTLYAHFRTLAELLEAAVQRAVDNSLEAIDAVDPRSGPAADALERMLEASWRHLALNDALARGVAEHLSSERLHRAHAPLIARTTELVERGRAEGAFRTDLPVEWLVTAYYSLVHAAADLARTRGKKRADVLAMLEKTVLELFRGAGRLTRPPRP